MLGMPGDNPSEAGDQARLESVGGWILLGNCMPASWDCKVYRSVGKTLTIWASLIF